MEEPDINETKDKNEADEKSELDLHTKITIYVIIAALIGGYILVFNFMGSEITLAVAPIGALICGTLILAIKKGWMVCGGGRGGRGGGGGGGEGGGGGGGGE